MTPAALLVGFARTIEVVLSDGQIIDTIVYSIAGLLEGLPAEASAIGMLLVQTICNLVKMFLLAGVFLVLSMHIGPAFGFRA